MKTEQEIRAQIETYNILIKNSSGQVLAMCCAIVETLEWVLNEQK